MPMKKIGTHDGNFHCDEILALVMLRQLPEYKDAEVIRSRDPVKLGECDILVDVGGEFDPGKHRYDHHQASFNRTIKDFHSGLKPSVKLSSAGLIYAHFGKRVLAQVTGRQLADPDIDLLFSSIYNGFVSEVDAIDNGIPIASVPSTYTIHTGLSSRISSCNPSWMRPNADELECFNRAYKIVEEEFISKVQHLSEEWLPARDVVREAILSRYSVHPSGLIVRLSTGSCPWKQHFFYLEKNLLNVSDVGVSANSFRGRPVFILTQRTDGFGVMAIPHSSNLPFSKRVPLVGAWAGKRDGELSELVGVPGCIFVHSNLFLGVHKSYEGALEMALLSLKAVKYI